MAQIHYANQPLPEHDLWPIFTVPWNDTLTGVTDMSFLLESTRRCSRFYPD